MINGVVVEFPREAASHYNSDTTSARHVWPNILLVLFQVLPSVLIEINVLKSHKRVSPAQFRSVKCSFVCWGRDEKNKTQLRNISKMMLTH